MPAPSPAVTVEEGARRRTSRRRRQLRRRRILLALGGVSLLLVVVALLEAARLGPALDDLDAGQRSLADATRALGSSPGEWTAQRISVAEPLGTAARARLVAGRDRLRRDPLLAVLRWVPLAGDQATAALDLSDAGVGASDAFLHLVAVARVYDGARADTSPAGEKLLTLLSRTSAPLEAAAAAVRAPLAALEADLQGPLLPPLRSRVQQGVDRLRPVYSQARNGSIAGKYLPLALGGAGPRSYLVLLANPAELRPAGGYAGAVGSVTFEHGSPTALHVADESEVSGKVRQHFEPPYPLGRYLAFKNNSLELGDSTWDPDFPSSAALAERINTAATGAPVDGTISIDPYALGALLKVTGPVEVPPHGRFTAENFFTRIDHIVNVDTSGTGGKAALGPIAEAVLNRILAQPVGSWPALLSVFQEQGKSRHVQFSMHDPALARAATSAGYDGALVPGHRDYVMAVDGNVGATKGDFYTTKTMNLKVELPASGISRHEVTLTYDLPMPRDADDAALNPVAGGQYRDYLRLYLPQTAHVAGFRFTEDGQPSSDGGMDRLTFEHGRAVVGIFFRLPRGHRVQVRLDYEVPLGSQSSYELFAQKQAGIPGRATSVEYSYPGGRGRQSADGATDAQFKVSW